MNINSGHFEGLAAWGIFWLVGLIILAIPIVLLLPALTLAALARRQAENIRNRRVNTIIAQYDPPQNLTPAEVGLLYDMQCGVNEIRATLFDLERRHIVAVVDDHKVQIVDEAAYAQIPEYEKIAIRIFNGETEHLDVPRTTPITYVDQQTGDTRTFELVLPPKKTRYAFTTAVQQSLEQKGIKMNNYLQAFLSRIFILTILIGLLPMLYVGSPGVSNGVSYAPWSMAALGTAVFITILFGIFMSPVYVVAAAVLVAVWAKLAGRYWLNTREARALWPEIEGYRLYLKQVDLDNIQFESMDGGHSPVTDTMPYAMVFGMDTKWQERLANR